MRRPRLPALLLMLGGAVLWAVHFLVVYGIAAVACARGFAAATWSGIAIVPALLAVATALALAGAALLGQRGAAAMHAAAAAGDRSRRFAGFVAAGLAALALLAIAYEALPVLMLPLCR